MDHQNKPKKSPYTLKNGLFLFALGACCLALVVLVKRLLEMAV